MLFACVHHGNDESVDETHKVGIVMLSGVQPLRDVDEVTAVEELTLVGVFFSLCIARSFVSCDKPLCDMCSSVAWPLTLLACTVQKFLA